MRLFQRLIVPAIAFAAIISFRQTPQQDGYQLIWSDEFDGHGLPDTSKWNYDVGGESWGNAELEFYTDKRAENARVENGMLVIESRKEKWKNLNFIH